jgi:uncharacterized cupin superfamily protein
MATPPVLRDRGRRSSLDRMPNVFEPDWDAERDEPPFRWRRARLGRQAGSRDLGASLFEVPPGAATFALHAHYANEELIIVLSGRPTLTDRDGERRRLAPGDLVACPAGRAGAHRLDNETGEPVRVLVVSTMRAPEINEMLEDGTFWVRDYAPGLTPEEPDLDVPGLRPAD